MQLFRTIVTDFDWVCEDSWIPAFSQSMFFIGNINKKISFKFFIFNSILIQHFYNDFERCFFVQKKRKPVKWFIKI